MNTASLNLPIRFQPLFRPYIWGGRSLATYLGKAIPVDGIWAESWELVDHGADQSIVSDGDWSGYSLRKLIESNPQAILGYQASSNDQFPLLLKYLDCQRVLSIQVHPNDEYGATMSPPDLGKTEAWYVLNATEEALIYAGLKRGIGRRELSEAILNNEIEECLHSFHPQAGDCVFIPAGTVHALGAGLIVAEIQQASDTTFRLFDWNRLGAEGKPRPLHIDQALDVIDFNRGPITPVTQPAKAEPGSRKLVECNRFLLDEFRSGSTSSQKQKFDTDGHFAIATIVKGDATIISNGGNHQQLKLGQTVLLPAAIGQVDIELDINTVMLVARPPRSA